MTDSCTPRRARRRAFAARTLPAVLAAAALAGPARADASDPWVRSWGDNSASQLGNGTTLNQQTPGAVKGIVRADVRELAAGGGNSANSFAVVLLNDGTVISWGGNTNGQLGNGTTTSQNFPAAVAGLSQVSDVAAGVHFAFAVRGGRVLAWGSNSHGQLGNGTTVPDTPVTTTRPVAVQSLSKVKAIAAGCYHAVALREDGTVWTWGSNSYGQLGIGITTDQNTPKRVQGLEQVMAVSAGCYHSSALTAQGTVKTWGAGGNGRLGNDGTADSYTPVDVRTLTGVTKIIGCGVHNFAFLDDGSVKAWGWNDAGQLGDGTLTDRTTPIPVPGLHHPTSLACGWKHSVAALADQSVLVWGDNSAGQLGDGSTTTSLTPVLALPAGSGTTRVASSRAFNSSYAY